MKQIQVILTIDLDNDDYSLLLNKESGLTLETIVANLIENENHRLSFDFPALLLDIPNMESSSDEHAHHLRGVPR